MTFKYADKEFDVSFGMLFQNYFWNIVANEGGLMGVDLLATVIYDGHRAHCKLNSGLPVFKSKAEVYNLIESHCATDEGIEQEQALVAAFAESQFYKSMQEISEEVSKKK